MSSKREQVVAAVYQLVKAALPNADVARNRDRPQSIAPGGTVIVRDGDPGKPEIDLSPLTYNYDHEITLEVAGYASANQSREQVLDAMLTPIGTAVGADRSLGGLCFWLDVDAAVTDDIEAFGAETARWAEVKVVASYATPNPLT